MLEGSAALPNWGVADLVHMDELVPGVIARTLTASPMRRQAIFMAIANRAFASKDSQCNERDASLATVLRQERAREIIDHALGTVPNGLLGALERLGEAPLSSARGYARLFALFIDPKQRRKAEALRHVGQITEKMLLILDALDERWVHSETLNRLSTTVAAKDFNRSVAFAQSVSSKATDEAVVAAISRLAPTAPLSAIINRFVRRGDRFPPHPLTADEEIRPLDSARDFIECGRRYRNCIITKLDEALAGQVAFAEFQHECIVEFRPLSLGKGWLLAELHVARNGLVSSELAKAAEAKCAALGIPHVDHRDNEEDWRRYRRFVRNDGWPV
jgi:hypothetical protein